MSNNSKQVPSQWLELESDPGLFTLLLEDFGVEGVQVEEVYDLSKPIDDSEVFGFIFLFRWDHASHHHNWPSVNSKSSAGSSGAQKSKGKLSNMEDRRLLNGGNGSHAAYMKASPSSNGLFFAHQVVPNSCATHSLLSILMNCAGKIRLGSVLDQFKELSKNMSPEKIGQAIGEMPELAEAHNRHARPSHEENENSTYPTSTTNSLLSTSSSGIGLSQKGGQVLEDTFHFVCYVPVANSLYELDGLQPYPINHGPVEPGTSWTERCRLVIQARMKEAEQQDLRYNLMALVPDRRILLQERLSILRQNHAIIETTLTKILDTLNTQSTDMEVKPEPSTLHFTPAEKMETVASSSSSSSSFPVKLNDSPPSAVNADTEPMASTTIASTTTTTPNTPTSSSQEESSTQKLSTRFPTHSKSHNPISSPAFSSTSHGVVKLEDDVKLSATVDQLYRRLYNASKLTTAQITVRNETLTNLVTRLPSVTTEPPSLVVATNGVETRRNSTVTSSSVVDVVGKVSHPDITRPLSVETQFVPTSSTTPTTTPVVTSTVESPPSSCCHPAVTVTVPPSSSPNSSAPTTPRNNASVVSVKYPTRLSQKRQLQLQDTRDRGGSNSKVSKVSDPSQEPPSALRLSQSTAPSTSTSTISSKSVAPHSAPHHQSHHCFTPQELLDLLQMIKEHIRTCEVNLEEEWEKKRKYERDDARRTFNYDPFICTYLLFLHESNQLEELLQKDAESNAVASAAGNHTNGGITTRAARRRRCNLRRRN